MNEFELNVAYIQELYDEYLHDPHAVDASWQNIFSRMDAETAAELGNGRVARLQAAGDSLETAADKPGGRPLVGAPQRIAQNMVASLQVPTATSFREVPIKLLEENRILINSFLKAQDRGKMSFTHFIGWAVVKGLQQYPTLNQACSMVDGTAYIVERADVNLGIAIDLEKAGGRSLVVPCIKRANEMDFVTFYETYESLVRKARANRLEVGDLVGTTATLTNPGTLGTAASVPRLMAGQGTIIATGRINYPAAFQAMDRETLSDLGVSKVMTVSSTYDHRIIQGAESGLFLAYVEALLMGEHEFYEDVLRNLRIPYRPLSWQRDRNVDVIDKQQGVLTLVNNFRVRGHLLAHLDPLGFELRYRPDLDPATFGLSIWDFDRVFSTGHIPDLPRADLRAILSVMRDTYTQRIGVEYMHIQNLEQKLWLQQEMEATRNHPVLEADEKRRILRKLSDAEVFEKFLQRKYPGHKRFSLEGAEATIPLLDALVARAARHGVEEIVLGMAHRGRLNVLATIIGKDPKKIFAEFEDIQDQTSVLGSGDVKYHLGASGVVTTEDGDRIRITMSPNPSHLEAVDPVVEGMARARQDRAGESGCARYLPLLVHGDAAFAGQGVVAETLNLSQLEGYRTGGTVHLVINNQIGFTTSPRDTRSMLYATDVAKMVQAPIFHLNGDDPEAAVHVIRLAFDYRQRFGRDAIIDFWCYRRHGHNETDDPSYTQPTLYRKIKAQPSARRVYTERLLRNGTLAPAEVDEMERQFQSRLEDLLAATKAQEPPPVTGDPLAASVSRPRETWTDPETGIPRAQIDRIVEVVSSVPPDLNVHPKLAGQLERKAAMLRDGRIDWALAEQLALGSLLMDGTPVRMAGQDTQRGTFSQRHGVLHDQVTEETFTPLNHLSESQAPLRLYDSPLSEYACLGFEYGYSVAEPQALVVWEAQFGDFVNGAQIVIDQFISSSEDKWQQTSGLVLLLPHGFEGQGPEHSSARVERFLTLCAEDNMQVVVPTTPAQYFHVLRRQVLREVRKPLVVLTPKSLLRHPWGVSSTEAFAGGRFQPVLLDPEAPPEVSRVVFCCGKIYYDLAQARGDKKVALIRVEQLYPFPDWKVREILQQHASVPDVLWVQEEPKNMGAWMTIAHDFREVLQPGQTLSFLGRPASGSPASGSLRVHEREQLEIIRRALD